MAVTIQVFGYNSSIDNAFAAPMVATWTNLAKDVVFSTKSPGGYSECSFRINTSSSTASEIYSRYHHYFIRIGDGGGTTLWEGRIEAITYEQGQVTIICNGLWSNMFDAFYDDGTFSGNPGAEHSILNADSTRELNSTYLYLAQSFQLSEPLAIRDIAVRLTNDGTGVAGDVIYVSLREDTSGSPSGAYLASVAIQTETIGTEETIFTGLTTSYRLNANTPYWIVIHGVAATADSIGWRYDSSSGYTDGSMKYYTSSWAAFSGDAIFYVWTHPRFYYYSIDLENGDFEETAGAGTFDDWTDNTGTGSIAIETSSVYEGTNAAKLTAGSGLDTYIYQDIPVVMGSDYTLSVYTQGDGTYSGRYRIYDVTNSADITSVTSLNVTAATYTLKELDFSVPATCEWVRVYFYCPSTNGGIAYFDFASIDGDYSSAADIIYDTCTKCNFVRDSTWKFYDDGVECANPIMFTNNEKPGDVVSKVTAFGSSDGSGLFCGVYDDMYMHVQGIDDGHEWYVSLGDLVPGEQALSITSTLDNMKTHVATLYSDVVGSRAITTWQYIPDMYDKFGYRREGLFSIAGASEAIADIISGVVAAVYSSPGQELALVIGAYVKSRGGMRVSSAHVKAGDKIHLSNVLPNNISALGDRNVIDLYVKETSYDVDTMRLTVVPSEMNMTLVDTILALAGLSGGSMV